jgi:hypothetical protein
MKIISFSTKSTDNLDFTPRDFYIVDLASFLSLWQNTSDKQFKGEKIHFSP